MDAKRLKKIAAASSAGFAMPITAQMEDENPPSMFDRNWADDTTRMFDELQDDQGIAEMAESAGVDNVVPTGEQMGKIDEMKEMFGDDLMDMFGDETDGEEGLSDEELLDGIEASNFHRVIRLAAHLDSIGLHSAADELDMMAMEDTVNVIEARGRRGRGLMDGTGPRMRCLKDDDIECPEPNDDPVGRGPGKGFGTGRGRGLMDGTGPRSKDGTCVLEDDEDEVGIEIEADFDDYAAKRPRRRVKRSPLGRGRGTGRGPGTGPRAQEGTCPFVGKPSKKASLRTAQVALQESGIDPFDIDLEEDDDQAKIISFDPERGNMVVQSPDEIFKLYSITDISEDGKPRFEFERIIDTPDDRLSGYMDNLAGGNPSLEGYGGKLPAYLDQLVGGNPDIQQAYASNRRNHR